MNLLGSDSDIERPDMLPISAFHALRWTFAGNCQQTAEPYTVFPIFCEPQNASSRTFDPE
jgi:hypothetical protein